MYSPADPCGTAVLVCPGGGYNILAISHEGTDVCRWLNGLGVTAALLHYRVPNLRDAAFTDAQRAMGLLRRRSAEFGIRPDRIGLLGFSAGGHLAARVCAHDGPRMYAPVDDADEAPARPDFAVLIYPAYLADTNSPGGVSATLPAGAHCPPTFLVHAADDRSSPANSISWFLALRGAGVPAEMYVYESGGHGFGMKTSVPPTLREWPERCAEWMRDRGLVPALPP